MATAPLFRVLLIAVIARCRSDSTIGFNHKNGKAASKFGELLKPPPPPHGIVPVPFHGPSRSQRQNVDTGYIYQPPPPPPPPPLLPSSEFKFPAPFYKQYNFNFVPPPQPFTTTPSPSLFQKVSGWLFPSQQPQTTYGEPQTSYGTPIYNSNAISTGKKDCNPCNLVPWIPVLRYNSGKTVQQNLIPTYGPPSPTAYAPNFIGQYNFQPLLPQDHKVPQQQGVPHAVYGPPAQNVGGNNYFAPVSTYGPPSPTHTITNASPNPLSSTHSIQSSSVGIPGTSYGVPSSSTGHISSTYGVPSNSINLPSSSYGVPSSTYGPPLSSYGTPSSSYENSGFVTSTFSPITPDFEPSSINNDLPSQSDVDVFQNTGPSSDQQLPKVTYPSRFRNSYGEPITNLNNIPFPVSATAAESMKIKTEVLPDDSRNFSTPNASLALANPAPFTLNRGRNIHTLQPVALPNLSVSPLPPIFNARPFRPITTNHIIKNLVPDINSIQTNSANIKIQQSVPLAEYTHSVDYPPTVVKSTLIDIEEIRNNQSKAYRNIPNGYVDEMRDISSQASEDHVGITKSNQDVSFESTGTDYGNDLYDTNLPLEMKYNDKIPTNHKSNFADLRGVKDEDIDKYRTESNLQSIDSPLLYLKPSAPNKGYKNFIFTVSTPGTEKDYEIYDDVPTTVSPQTSSISSISAWDESRTYSEGLLPPRSQENNERPKIVQIIVPYTTNQHGQPSNIDYENNIPDYWTPTPEEEYQGRKVPPDTESPYVNTVTESYSTVSTTEEPVTETYESEGLNTQAILNDLYDVKEPPFDIIKLQHTIDDWTEQEYSKRFKPHKARTSAKYAKQIPDEYFTTLGPYTNFVTAATNYYEFYDHEGSSSIRHSVTDNKNISSTKPRKEYNTIERTKAKHYSAKNEDEDESKKPHIYTAASSFRSTTTTQAPWGSIQTSISPLTKEKVYVVTAKPWKESPKVNDKANEWYDVEQFESKKTSADNDVTASDNLPFQSPRFYNRPSFGFTSSGTEKIEPLKPDSSYAFSKNWHQRINELDNLTKNHNTTLPGGSDLNVTTNDYSEETGVPNTEEDTAITTTTTADPQESRRR